jgi:putative salt-induced outer membrane protein
MSLLKVLSPLLLWLPMLVRAEGWSGEATLGYLSTSGNATTESVSARLALDYTQTRWKNSFSASAINTSDSGVTRAERYTVGDKVDFNFDERNYAFGALEYEKDLFGGVRERTSETAGYGRHVLSGPVHHLDLEAGVGARQTEAQTVAGVRGEQDRDLIGRAFVKYKWEISPTSTFGQTLKIESGASNTFSESVSELKLSVVGNLFATLSYTVKHNSEVPAGTEQMDTFSAVSLSYKFGQS